MSGRVWMAFAILIFVMLCMAIASPQVILYDIKVIAVLGEEAGL